MRKNNSRADWWEARQMPRQWHPQGLGAGGRRPSQHNQLTQYRRGTGGGIDEPPGSPEGSEARAGDGDQFNGSSNNVEYDSRPTKRRETDNAAGVARRVEARRMRGFINAGNATKMLPDKTGDWSEYYNLKWDAWNRVVEVKDSGGNVVAAYAYDGTTRRITKTVSAVVTHFYYNDQWKAIEERVDAETDAERQYAWGTQFRNDLILRDRDTTGNGTLDERLYATHDALGNCTAILNTSGAVQERYGYSAFGVRRIMQADFSARASSSFAWDFGFQGEFLDDETGYVNYGFRYYLPYLGRWINRDPIGEDGGNNLYMMVGNNAVNRVDKLGKEEEKYCEGCPMDLRIEIQKEVQKITEEAEKWQTSRKDGWSLTNQCSDQAQALIYHLWSVVKPKHWQIGGLQDANGNIEGKFNLSRHNVVEVSAGVSATECGFQSFTIDPFYNILDAIVNPFGKELEYCPSSEWESRYGNTSKW